MITTGKVNNRPAIINPEKLEFVPLPDEYRLIETSQGIVGAFDMVAGKAIEMNWQPLLIGSQEIEIVYEKQDRRFI